MIVSPLGEILAGPEVGGEAILRAELDLAQIAEGKYDFDVAGHYARPDIFSLSVNDQPTPVVFSRHEPTRGIGEPVTLDSLSQPEVSDREPIRRPA